MAKQSKIGVCENCGDKGALTGSFGRQVCSTCLKIRSNVNSHLPKIANAARAMHKAEELVGLIIGKDGVRAEVESTTLDEIAGIVGYAGKDGAELVESVRRRALACASCEAEDVLHEIREIVGYTPELGDKGLADAVLALVASGGTECNNEELRLRDDLARACDMGEDCSYRWGSVAQGAIQEIARLTNRKAFWIESAEDLRARVAKLSAELTLAEQSRDEWEQRAVQAEANVADQAAELNRLENVPRTDTTYLLDIALRALRGEGPDADQLAVLIDAARRAA